MNQKQWEMSELEFTTWKNISKEWFTSNKIRKLEYKKNL